MDEQIAEWLGHILEAINSVESYLGSDRNYFAYLNDKKTRRAVEREIEIIGEATNRILKRQPDFPLINGRKLVNTRNTVIHGYDKIDDSAIWGMINRRLPMLKTEVEQLLVEK